MGYSIATPTKSVKAHAAMLAFLKEHYRSLDTLVDNLDDDGLRGPLDHDLSYMSRIKRFIGFDYTSWSPGREYATAMCRWIALRAGRKRTMPVFKKDGVVALIPYYVHDGLENVPVRLRTQWEVDEPEHKQGFGWHMVDEHGWNGDPYSFFNREIQIGLYPKGWVEAMQEELKRLSKLWKENCNSDRKYDEELP